MLLSVAGWYPTFCILKKSVKREMKKRMAATKDNPDCLYFLFTKQEYASLKWIEKHEFRHNGQMYDVLSEEWYNEGVVLYCYHDQKESWLYAELEAQHSAETGKVKHIRQLLKYSAAVYTLPAPVQLTPDYPSGDYNADNRSGHYNVILQTESPPPKTQAS